MTARSRRLLATVVVLLSAALLVPVPASGAAAQEGIAVDLVEVGPDVLAPGSTLTVTVTVRNEGAAPLEAPLVRLKLAPRLLPSRAAVAEWGLADDDEFSGSVVAEVPLPEGLPPGGQVTLPLTIAADDLGLPAAPQAWGPRGVAVSVLDRDFAQAALTRTHVVWYPGRAFAEPVRTSVLVPLTGAAPEVASGLVPPAELSSLTADDGRLAAALTAASAPGVTWALDPALLASADAAGVEPQGGDTTAWLDRLRSAATDREVVALPYADPDVSALVHAGQAELIGLAEELGRDAVSDLLGAPARTDVAWPVSGSVDAATLAAVAAEGRSAVVLSQGAQPLVRAASITTTGRSRLAAGGNAVAGLLVDTPLSTTLAGTGRSVGGARTAESVADDVQAVQRLLAETAALTMERPSVARHVLVTAPRTWDPDPVTGARAVAALTAVPWVQAAPLGELVDATAPDDEREALRYEEGDAAGELPAQGLQTAGGALADARRMAPALTRPEEVLDRAELSAVAASSASWRADPATWQGQVESFGAASTALVQGVHVVPGSAINVLSARVDLPLTVTNDLDQDVTVQVRLRPGSARLVSEGPVLVSIAAGESERVAFPVRAIASGDTDVEVQLRTPAGELVGEPVLITVRVRADWENRGTAALAVVAGVVLLVGLVRTIRRGRRTTGAVTVDTSSEGPDEPEERGRAPGGAG